MTVYGMPTPNYVLTEAVSVRKRTGDTVSLSSGAFVRPIEVTYLPKHITEADHHQWFNPVIEVYVYRSAGIVKIRKDQLRPA